MPESMGPGSYLPEEERLVSAGESDSQQAETVVASESGVEEEPQSKLEAHRTWRDNWFVKNHENIMGAGVLLGGMLMVGGIFLLPDGTVNRVDTQEQLQIPRILLTSGVISVFTGALVSGVLRAYEGARGMYERSMQDKQVHNELRKQYYEKTIASQEQFRDGLIEEIKRTEDFLADIDQYYDSSNTANQEYAKIQVERSLRTLNNLLRSANIYLTTHQESYNKRFGKIEEETI